MTRFLAIWLASIDPEFGSPDAGQGFPRNARPQGRDSRQEAPSRRRSPRRPPESRHRRPLHWRPLFWVTLLLASGLAGGVTRGYRVWQDTNASLPDTSQALTYQRGGTITLRSADDVVLQKIGPASRETIAYQDIPPDLINAFIAAEDSRFYEHKGIDLKGILRAAQANIRNREVVEGASTITQQLARIVYLDQAPTFQRKAREAMLALQLEKDLSKEQILERYLNLVYLGAGAYGVADAAWIYFGKQVNELTLAESALIAGMAPAPSNYSPLVNEAAAKQQRDRVINRMLATGAITSTEASEALATPVAVTPNQPKFLYSEFPYFTIYVQKQLGELLTPEQLEAGGLTVETTLNVGWQRKAETTVQDALDTYGRWQRVGQTALVAIDPRNGEIKAMVGGNDFDESQFNRVTQAQRQPGSTFKAFVYTTAIAAGFSPYKNYVDAKYVVDGYEPKNYGGSYRGSVDLVQALRSSINIVAVKLLVDVGFDPVIDMAHRMGIKSELLPTYSLALGASEVNLLELTSAYGTLANQGKHVPVHGIRRVLNSRGEVIYDFQEGSEQAVDPDTAAIMTWMLRGVVESGTGRNAALGRPVAGKTGTSEKNRDLWFVGYIPQLVTGVWMGNDDSTPTYGASSSAAAVWRMFMSQLTEEIPVEQFPDRPSLNGREGTIEAKPVKPGKVVASKSSESQEQQSTSNNRPVENSSGESAESGKSSESAGAGSSDSSGNSGSSNSSGSTGSNPQPSNSRPRPAASNPAPAPVTTPAPITEPPPAAPAPTVEPAVPASNPPAPEPAPPPKPIAPAPAPPPPLTAPPANEGGGNSEAGE